MADELVVLCTCSSGSEARRIAKNLVESRLAACVTMLGSPVRSVFRWNDKVKKSWEELLLIKTNRKRFPGLRDRIAELHSYDTPEIIAVPIADGSEKYLSWLREQL